MFFLEHSVVPTFFGCAVSSHQIVHVFWSLVAKHYCQSTTVNFRTVFQYIAILPLSLTFLIVVISVALSYCLLFNYIFEML